LKSRQPFGLAVEPPLISTRIFTLPFLGLFDLNLFESESSDSLNGIRNVPVTADYFDIGGHGNTGLMRDDRDGRRELLSPEQLQALIPQGALTGMVAVKLWSCRTGKGGNSFAQQLADLLGVPVIAPTRDFIVTRYSASVFSCPFRRKNKDGWVLFRPGGLPPIDIEGATDPRLPSKPMAPRTSVGGAR